MTTAHPAHPPRWETDGFLFNESSHVHLQTTGPVHWQTLTDPQTGLLQARCAFVVKNGTALSPAAAPFGSVEFAPGLPTPALSRFVGALINQARSRGAQRLRLVNYPHCYAPEQIERLTPVLLAQGFRVIQNTPTYYLPVTGSPLADRARAAERQRLRKCKRAGLLAAYGSASSIPAVVEFIRESRRQHGYPLTIAPGQLQQLLSCFPEKFPVFTVRHGAVLAALCVGVRVRSDIMYTFLPASRADYRAFSPMVMLLDFIYRFCQERDIRLLDLGTCLDHELQPKPSLARFKENMGACPSPKLTFEREL